MKFKFAFLSLLYIFSFGAWADNPKGLLGSVGIVNTEFDTGSNVTAGYFYEYNHIRANINFVDMNIYSVEPEGYRKETLSNGNQVCRDESNGQFANEELCTATEIDYGFSLEAGYLFNQLELPLLLGLGVRLAGDEKLGGKNVSYFNLQLFNSDKAWYGELKASLDYTQFSMGMTF